MHELVPTVSVWSIHFDTNVVRCYWELPSHSLKPNCCICFMQFYSYVFVLIIFTSLLGNGKLYIVRSLRYRSLYHDIETTKYINLFWFRYCGGNPPDRELCKLSMCRFKPAVAVMLRKLTREVPGLNLARNIRYSNWSLSQESNRLVTHIRPRQLTSVCC